jgi:hypothetical protein
VLARHGQAEVAEDAVGLLLVGRDLDRDVPRLRGDGRPDALLVAAVAELHERLVVEADPRDVAPLGGADQRARRRAELPALGEGDQLVERLLEVEARGHEGAGREVRREQRVQQVEREVAGGLADALLLVLVDDEVLALRAGPAGLAEGDLGAREHLDLDRYVLEHVAEPGPAVLTHAADEPALLAVRAGVLLEAGERGEQGVDEPGDRGRRVGLELAEVEVETDHRKVGVEVGTTVGATLEDLHGEWVRLLPQRAGFIAWAALTGCRGFRHPGDRAQIRLERVRLRGWDRLRRGTGVSRRRRGVARAGRLVACAD